MEPKNSDADSKRWDEKKEGGTKKMAKLLKAKKIKWGVREKAEKCKWMKLKMSWVFE